MKVKLTGTNRPNLNHYSVQYISIDTGMNEIKLFVSALQVCLFHFISFPFTMQRHIIDATAKKKCLLYSN